MEKVHLRAVLYTRQSKEREHSESIEDQIEGGVRYCHDQGYEIVGEPIEDRDTTGTSMRSRPGIRRAIQMIQDKDADILVIWRLSRMARDEADGHAIIRDIEAVDGFVESYTEKFENNAAGKLHRAMTIAMDAHLSRQISETWKRAHAKRLELGLPTDGRPRYGYDYERSPKPGDPPKEREPGYHINPTTAPFLAEAYRRYIKGAGMRALVGYLNEAGQRTSTGTEWTERILSNTLDGGFGAGVIRTGKTRGQIVFRPGRQEPVISAAEWDAYVIARKERSILPTKSQAPKWALSTLVTCGLCGARMTRFRRTNGRYSVRCSRFATAKTCTGVWCPQDPIEHHVALWIGGHVDAIARHLVPDEDRTKERMKFEALVEKSIDDVHSSDDKLARLERRLLDGEVEVEPYRIVKADLSAEREAAVKIGQTAQSELARLVPLTDTYEKLAAGTENIEPSEWRHVLSQVLRRVEVHKDKLVIVPQIGAPHVVQRSWKRASPRKPQPTV